MSPLDAAMVGPARHERVENDFYATPAWVTEVLLRYVRLGRVWEPACGDGAMVDVLRAAGVNVVASDIVHGRGTNGDYGRNFLDWSTDSDCDIVTNPPYTHAEEFIRHALALTQDKRCKVAMVLRHEYDCAKTRADLFNQPPFAMKIVLTKRPMWIAGTTGSPRHNYAIYVWDWLHRGPATLVYDQ